MTTAPPLPHIHVPPEVSTAYKVVGFSSTISGEHCVVGACLPTLAMHLRLLHAVVETYRLPVQKEYLLLCGRTAVGERARDYASGIYGGMWPDTWDIMREADPPTGREFWNLWNMLQGRAWGMPLDPRRVMDGNKELPLEPAFAWSSVCIPTWSQGVSAFINTATPYDPRYSPLQSVQLGDDV